MHNCVCYLRASKSFPIMLSMDAYTMRLVMKFIFVMMIRRSLFSPGVQQQPVSESVEPCSHTCGSCVEKYYTSN